MTYLLLEYPDLDGVFAINDPSALGAEEATRQMNNRHALITSVDASPLVLERLISDDTNLIASVAQFPRAMARKAVKLALERLSGQFQEQKTTLIPTKLVTKGNADKFSQWQELK
jgi:ribose transport system substrate-binding protein